MKKRFVPQTTCSISVRAPECTAVKMVAHGTPDEILKDANSLTGKYLSGRRRLRCRGCERRAIPSASFKVIGARGNNLKKVRRGVSARPLHLRDRRFGLGQVHAGERHAVHPCQSQAERHRDGHGALRRDSRSRGDRSHHRNRPEPDRTHAALQPGHLHRLVRSAARIVCRSPGVAHARLRRRPFQLQRERRSLRGLPGRRPHQGGDALPAGRLCALRCLQGSTLQPRNTRDPLARQEHPRSART